MKMANDVVVDIISREMIKPFSSKLAQQPFKISYFDQLTPTTYAPIIFFYSSSSTDHKNTLTLLKSSLSKTLDIYYPLSGRVKNNIVVDSFNEGIPFSVSQVNRKMSEFLNKTESLNKFLPCQPFSKEIDMEGDGLPLLKFQVNIFTCGGIAIGTCLGHKIADVTTFGSFMKTWAAISLGFKEKAILPNLSKASTAFPPTNQFPQSHERLMNKLWFSQKNLVTKRFIFDEKSIRLLRSKVKGSSSRLEMISGFIWKCYMSSGKSNKNLNPIPAKASLLVQAVNLRPRSTQDALEGAIGNLFWWAPALANPDDEEEKWLDELLENMKSGVSIHDDDYLKSLQGDEGFLVLSDTLEQLEGIVSIEKPDILAFTSWCHQGLNEINFGFGDPVWLGMMGKPGEEFRNLVVYIENKNKGIEAWITLKDKRMAALEQHDEFINFTSVQNSRL